MTDQLTPAESALRDAARDYHRLPTPGKISVSPTKPLTNQRDLSLAYSPGVAYPCLDIAADPDKAADYTSRGNLVGVVTNGTAVLGLGDIGPLAAKPVMEGKGCLFKKFAGIDVFDIELAERDPDKLIDMIAALEPTLGGINLEDIKAPECFYIERKLSERLNIPVFHDDQHGTAIISAAAIRNGLELVGKDIGKVKLVVSGAGAAAIAVLDLLVNLGLTRSNVFACDSKGLIYEGRGDSFNAEKSRYAQKSNLRTLADVMPDADVFLGCSTGGVLTQDMVRGMAPRPIILALANPEPEIRPELAKAARPDCIIATGRSDYSNQVNNVLCFPYIFRGALDSGATKITEAMKLACVQEIADLAKAEVSDEVASAYAGQELSFGDRVHHPEAVRLATDPADRAGSGRGGGRLGRRDATDRRHGGLPRAADAHVLLGRHADAPGVRRGAGLLAQAHRVRGRRRPARAARRADRARRRARRADADRPSLGDRGAHREGGPAPEARRGRHLREPGRRSALPPVLAGLSPHHGPPRREPRGGEGCGAPLDDDHRRADGAPRRCRRHALRPARPLRRAPREHPRRDRPARGRDGARDAERPDDRQAHAVHRRHLRERDAVGRAAGAHRAAVAGEVRLFGLQPKVAFVSHSNYGSSRRESAKRVREAYEIFTRLAPEVECDGEMHGDAALSEVIRKGNLMDSSLSGEANILICPNIDAANILFNVLKAVGGEGTTVGPILMGVAQPAHVLTPSSTVRRVLNMTALAAAQAGQAGRGEARRRYSPSQ